MVYIYKDEDDSEQEGRSATLSMNGSVSENRVTKISSLTVVNIYI
jgi:hypothetical protein